MLRKINNNVYLLFPRIDVDLVCYFPGTKLKSFIKLL